MLCFYLARLNLSKKLYRAIPEKNPNRGVEDMEFLEVGKFLGSIQKEMEFTGAI